MSLQKRKLIRSKAIRKAAEGERCSICGTNDGTTVFCHLNEYWAGKALSQKADDIAGFFGCRDCHDEYDGRSKEKYTTDALIMRAMYRTIRRLWEKGIIIIR